MPGGNDRLVLDLAELPGQAAPGPRQSQPRRPSAALATYRSLRLGVYHNTNVVGTLGFAGSVFVRATVAVRFAD